MRRVAAPCTPVSRRVDDGNPMSVTSNVVGPGYPPWPVRHDTAVVGNSAIPVARSSTVITGVKVTGVIHGWIRVLPILSP